MHAIAWLDQTPARITALAVALGVTRQALSAFLNERSDLSPEMALRTRLGRRRT
jgi:plasmid maintenance system antidote protein VapI